MNQFLKYLDITDQINVEIDLSPVNQNHIPIIDLYFNGTELLSGKLCQKTKFNTCGGLLDKISILIKSKNNNALIVEKISIDGFCIIPDFVHHAQYIDFENNNMGPTEFIGLSGTWSFKIAEPFYNWKHRVEGNGWLLTP